MSRTLRRLHKLWQKDMDLRSVQLYTIRLRRTHNIYFNKCSHEVLISSKGFAELIGNKLLWRSSLFETLCELDTKDEVPCCIPEPTAAKEQSSSLGLAIDNDLWLSESFENWHTYLVSNGEPLSFTALQDASSFVGCRSWVLDGRSKNVVDRRSIS